MGQAKNKGSFEERKALAIALGRVKSKSLRSYGPDMIDMYVLMANLFAHKRRK